MILFVRSHKIQAFTTRPDTLFGVTYLVLAPEHPLLLKITSSDQHQEVLKYKEQCLRKSEVDRKINQDKTGCFTGAYAQHPITKNLFLYGCPIMC